MSESLRHIPVSLGEHTDKVLCVRVNAFLLKTSSEFVTIPKSFDFSFSDNKRNWSGIWQEHDFHTRFARVQP